MLTIPRREAQVIDDRVMPEAWLPIAWCGDHPMANRRPRPCPKPNPTSADTDCDSAAGQGSSEAPPAVFDPYEFAILARPTRRSAYTPPMPTPHPASARCRSSVQIAKHQASLIADCILAPHERHPPPESVQ